MTQIISLKDRCKLVCQNDGNRFVGLKIIEGEPFIYFPLGYQLPDADDEIQSDIINLFNILNEFSDKEKIIPNQHFDKREKVKFPFNAYMEIMRYYMENGYYIENDPVYKTRDKGKINWPRTIKNQRPLLQENDNGSYSPIYTSFTVRDSTPNDNKEITRIHQHCVYESFDKLGWIFFNYVPLKPEGIINTSRSLIILRKKLSNTNNDSKKRLFLSMIEMLEFMDVNTEKKDFFFGTETFENVWEKLIDKAFGFEDKNKYFPKTEWHLLSGEDPNFKPLEPDTIMIYKNKIYVIDAKYYRYGDTGIRSHLPPTASISKQITYGEYVKEKEGKDPFNAFLMPYNMKDNPFRLNGEFATIGEAISKWKSNDNKYEHIQGILVDTRFLMHNYENKEDNIIKLAEAIKDSCKKNKHISKHINI